MVLSGPTQDELLQRFASTGPDKISVDQYKALSAGVSAKINLAVSGNAGWLSIYLKGMQRPISMPVELAEDPRSHSRFSSGDPRRTRGEEFLRCAMPASRLLCD